MQRDEVYVMDLWRIFRREWAWFLAGLLIVLAAAFAFEHSARRQWEATGYLQIGQVAAVPQGQDPKAEPLARVLERLQLVSFQNRVLASIGVKDDAPEAKLYRKSLKLEPLPYAGPLVKFTVRGWSPEHARQFAEATAAQLQAVHRDLLAHTLALAQARQAQLQADLKTAEGERARLGQIALPGDAHDKDAQGAGVAAMLLATTNAQIRELRQLNNDLDVRLGASYTYDTSLMWPVYVPVNAAFPNPVLFGGIGLLFGCALGAFAAIARNAARRLRATPFQFNQTGAR
jgi:uncharacterized protein involved in exopolysaccharide biosynthesis